MITKKRLKEIEELTVHHAYAYSPVDLYEAVEELVGEYKTLKKAVEEISFHSSCQRTKAYTLELLDEEKCVNRSAYKR